MDHALALELLWLSRNTSRVLLLWPLLLPRSVAGSAPCFQRGYLVRVLSRLVPYFIFPTRSLVIYNSSVVLFGFLSLTLHLLALPPCRRVQRPHKHLGGTHAVHGKAGHALTCTSHICACQLWLTYRLFSFDDVLNSLSPPLHTHLSLILARQPPTPLNIATRPLSIVLFVNNGRQDQANRRAPQAHTMPATSSTTLANRAASR